MTTKQTKDQKMRERFKKKFLVGGFDSSVQFKEEVRGRLPQEFLKFLDEEIAKAREEGWQSGHKQTKEDMGEALRMKKINLQEADELGFGGYAIQAYNLAIDKINQKIDNYLKK